MAVFLILIHPNLKKEKSQYTMSIVNNGEKFLLNLKPKKIILVKSVDGKPLITIKKNSFIPIIKMEIKQIMEKII